MDNQDIREMVFDYMEKGFLENIIDMFRHDTTLIPLIAEMISDERMRVRIGAIAVVEELAGSMPDVFAGIIPQVAVALHSQNPTVRGDAAYLLSLLGRREVLPFLEEAVDDPDPAVREVIRDAISEVKAQETS